MRLLGREAQRCSWRVVSCATLTPPPRGEYAAMQLGLPSVGWDATLQGAANLPPYGSVSDLDQRFDADGSQEGAIVAGDDETAAKRVKRRDHRVPPHSIEAVGR